MDKKRIPSLNSLRFIFVIGIVLYHVNEFFGHYGNNSLGIVYKFGGAVGNYFFYMSSGILVAYLYRENIADGRISLKKWILKRMGKIYPLYIFSEALIIVIEIWNKGLSGITYKKIVTDLLLLTAGWIYGGTEAPYNGPAWFLCVLLLCYILYYFICRLCKNKESYICVIAFLVLVGIYLEHQRFEFPFCYRINGEGYAHFFLGCLLYHVYENYLIRRRKLCRGLALVVLGFMILGTHYVGADIIWGDMVTVLTVYVGLIIYCVVEIKPVELFLEIKSFKLLGGLSMQIFLLHMPVLYFYLKICSMTVLDTWSNPRKYAIYLVVMMIVCFVENYLEKVLTINKSKEMDISV